MKNNPTGKTIVFTNSFSDRKKYIEIISLIKDMILNGEIVPGDRLPSETQFIEQLGISRTPIREAIKILEAMGVIIIKRGEGMFLQRPISGADLNPLVFDLLMMSNELEKLIEFRQYFEQMLIEIVASKRSAEDCEKLKSYIEKQESIKHTADDREWIELDIGYHLMILEISSNPLLIAVGKTIYELYKNIRPKIIGPEDRNNTLETHRLYLEIIRQSNPSLIETLKDKIKANYSAISLAPPKPEQ